MISDKITYLFGWIAAGLALLVVMVGLPENTLHAQENKDLPNPKIALLKSVAMPGWGHYYVDNQNWNRGKYHLAGEVVLLVSYVGLNIRSNHLEGDMIAYAQSRAGVRLEDRDRGFRLAIGNFDNREAYNEFQLKTRNWGELYPDQEKYQWNWPSKDARVEYVNLRERIDRVERQLPALFSLMVVNRVFSGVSAYLRARDRIQKAPEVGLAPAGAGTNGGVVTRIRIPF